MPETQLSPIAQIIVNDDLIADLAKQYLKNFYDARLEKEWLSRSDIKQITGMKSDWWIREHIDNDPYVKAHGLKFDVTEEGGRAVPRYHKEIREFLKKFGR
jgi:hypothetical protein